MRSFALRGNSAESYSAQCRFRSARVNNNRTIISTVKSEEDSRPCYITNKTSALTKNNTKNTKYYKKELLTNGKFVKLAYLWITEVIHVLVWCAQLKELLLLPKVCVETQEPELVTKQNNLMF
ncbi:hypothetical protein NQ318_008227 [Aromia moschata]|uniref:Uncharacterized protein n=1 Tax=Aromia moschata TaxID=1265417 RepID=A0AAV8YK12_9CUCU|nr:hypothetical protein NQ318_008227 [Aromia moschata]